VSAGWLWEAVRIQEFGPDESDPWVAQRSKQTVKAPRTNKLGIRIEKDKVPCHDVTGAEVIASPEANVSGVTK
jgi:hypothetical protein